MHERELERIQRDSEPKREDHATPGRANTSASLTGPSSPVPSGILRKRDGDGVALDAESAVSAAAGSSGSALPGTLQRKFESSLGVDLSSVRVHTGQASNVAARAVSAKAYTTGQDIHFGAGHYDPSSAGGQHLIAHEVAHTVQQRGGVARRQNKLEVSGPQDAAEHEADRAADAMVRGAPALVGGGGAAISRKDEEVTFEDDYATPSSQMRDDGDKAVKQLKTAPPSRAELGTTRADVHHAVDLISKIEGARGPLSSMQGREEAANKEGQESQPAGKQFVPFNEASKAITHNTSVAQQLDGFQKSASRQGFQHDFFAQSYKHLQEEFVRLKATVEVIKQQNLKVVGQEAKSDIEEAKKANPLLADAIDNLKAAITDMQNTATSATAGIGAISSSAGITFDQVAIETDAMMLPPPKFEDEKEQKAAQADIAAINADLAMAKSTISTVKSVVEISFSLATGGTSAAGTKIATEALSNLGKKAEAIAEKHIDPHTDGLRHTKGAKAAASAGEKKGVEGLEGALADWMTSYSGRISAANGKLKGLNQQLKEKYELISGNRVRALQAQLADQIGKFTLLMMQFEEKKAAVTDAAKKVQEQAMKSGKKGTNIGAAAQAEASVSNFLTQADVAETLGQQEKEHGDAAQDKLEKVAGSYVNHPEKPAFPGGPAGIAETIPADADATYYLCKTAPDADRRGTYDFSGYEIQEGRIVFTVNEDDVDQRSVVMRDRTDEQLKNIQQWKTEAGGFKVALDEALGIGASTIK